MYFENLIKEIAAAKNLLVISEKEESILHGLSTFKTELQNLSSKVFEQILLALECLEDSLSEIDAAFLYVREHLNQYCSAVNLMESCFEASKVADETYKENFTLAPEQVVGFSTLLAIGTIHDTMCEFQYEISTLRLSCLKMQCLWSEDSMISRIECLIEDDPIIKSSSDERYNVFPGGTKNKALFLTKFFTQHT